VDVDGRRLQTRLAHPLYCEVRRSEMGVLRARRLRGLIATALAGTGARRSDDIVRRAVLALDSDLDPDPGLFVTAAKRSGDFRTMNGHRKSFHAVTNPNRPSTNAAGRAIGNAIRQKICQAPAPVPSIRAACISSSLMVLEMCWRIQKMPKALASLGTISASVSTHSSAETIRYCGMTAMPSTAWSSPPSSSCAPAQPVRADD
jgi:hypothetical protein